MQSRSTFLATIAASEAVSGAVDILGHDLVAVAMPDTWTAAAITFQTSDDGNTFYDVVDGTGSEISLTVDVDQWVQVPDTALRQFGRFVKFRSGTSGTPVNQAAERTLKVVGGA